MESCTQMLFSEQLQQCLLGKDSNPMFLLYSPALFFNLSLISMTTEFCISSMYALLAYEIKRGWDLVQNRKATHTWFQRLRGFQRFHDDAPYLYANLQKNLNSIKGEKYKKQRRFMIAFLFLVQWVIL